MPKKDKEPPESLSPEDVIPQVREESTAGPVLRPVEERLIKADSPREIVLWTQVRGEILRQNESIKHHNHRRSLEMMQVRYKMGFSVAAVVVGVLLILLGLPYPGLFTLGAGLFGVVPDYVRMFFEFERDDGVKNEERETLV